jgi:hypothetical protein
MTMTTRLGGSADGAPRGAGSGGEAIGNRRG